MDIDRHKQYKKARIGILDSGAGGLSVTLEILKRKTQAELFYLADAAAFPYAELDHTTLTRHLCSIVEIMISRYELDIIVIACNTASTISLEHLRKEFDIPFVGVVPAIKPAAALSKTKSIAVLATPNTIINDYTKNLAKDFGGDCDITYIGNRTLVEHIEQHISGQDLSVTFVRNVIQEKLNLKKNIDTLILSCTHFPLIKNTIKDTFIEISNSFDYFKNNKNETQFYVLDSGEAIARRVHNLLDQNKKPIHFLENDDNEESKLKMTFILSSEKPIQAQTKLIHYAKFIQERCSENSLHIAFDTILVSS